MLISLLILRLFIKDNVFITYQPMYIMGRASDDDSFSLTADEYYNALEVTKIDKMKGDDAIKRNRKINMVWHGRNVLSIESDGKVYPYQLLHSENCSLVI